MRLLLMIAFLLLGQVAAQQRPCDMVAEQELPDCNFTARSNFGLHGPVHTVRVQRRELAPDPRTRGASPGKMPRLSVREPGVWVVFSPEGEMIENAGSLSADGTPMNPSREITASGPDRITISGTSDEPGAFRTVSKTSADGRTVEQFSYFRGKLTSHSVQQRDVDARSLTNRTYDADNKLVSSSIERYDERGRVVEVIISDHDRLFLHQRDTFDDTVGAKDARALISRVWYDEEGLVIREIALRNGQMTWSWQRKECGDLCNQSNGAGFNFPFDRTTSYDFEPDGALLTTIEWHRGRYGNIDDDLVELLNVPGVVLEKIAYRYERDQHGNWTERTTSILDPTTGQMIDVRLDRRELTYYAGNQR